MKLQLLYRVMGCVTMCGSFAIAQTTSTAPTTQPSPATQAATTTRVAVPHFTPAQLKLPGKKGICYSMPLNDHPARSAEENAALRKENVRRMTDLQVSWSYTWGMPLVEEQPSEVEFMPMVFGKGLKGPDAVQKLTAELATRVAPHIASGRVVRLLGPNEPDREKHGDLTPEQTIAIWPAMEALGVPLCSPSPANTEGVGKVGANWMPEFMAEVDRRGLRVDYIGTHAYASPNPEALKKRLRRIYEKYGKRPLLITEFGVTDWSTLDGVSKNRYTQAQVLAYMKDVLPWMERQDWIAGYAWFPFKVESPHGASSALFDADGKLNALGRFYRSVTPSNPDGDQTIQPD
jgi:hypothetical protein